MVDIESVIGYTIHVGGLRDGPGGDGAMWWLMALVEVLLGVLVGEGVLKVESLEF